MNRFELSESAEADLAGIDYYTIERFGLQQAIKILNTFESAFQLLAENPDLGHQRVDISPVGREFRYWPVLNRFVIVFEPCADGMRVARVLDGSRDMAALLEGNPGD